MSRQVLWFSALLFAAPAAAAQLNLNYEIDLTKAESNKPGPSWQSLSYTFEEEPFAAYAGDIINGTITFAKRHRIQIANDESFILPNLEGSSLKFRNLSGLTYLPFSNARLTFGDVQGDFGEYPAYSIGTNYGPAPQYVVGSQNLTKSAFSFASVHFTLEFRDLFNNGASIIPEGPIMFSPDRMEFFPTATVLTSPVPDTETWLMLVLGLGVVGTSLRRRRLQSGSERLQASTI